MSWYRPVQTHPALTPLTNTVNNRLTSTTNRIKDAWSDGDFLSTKAVWKHLERYDKLRIALRTVEDDEFTRHCTPRVHRNDRVVEVAVLSAVVEVAAAGYGARRTTELLHLLGLVHAAECRTNDDHTLLTQQRLPLHEVCNNVYRKACLAPEPAEPCY